MCLSVGRSTTAPWAEEEEEEEEEAVSLVVAAAAVWDRAGFRISASRPS